MARRKGRKIGEASFSAIRMICGECGGAYGSKVWHSNTKYRRVIWRCNSKYGEYNEKTGCSTPHLTEDEIKTLCVKALALIQEEREEIIANTRTLMESIYQTEELEKEVAEREERMNRTGGLLNQAIAQNMRAAIDQEAYRQEFERMEKEYEEQKEQFESASARLQEVKSNLMVMEGFVERLKEMENPDASNEEMWASLIDSMTINSRTDVVIALKGGMEIRTGLER